MLISKKRVSNSRERSAFLIESEARSAESLRCRVQVGANVCQVYIYIYIYIDVCTKDINNGADVV